MAFKRYMHRRSLSLLGIATLIVLPSIANAAWQDRGTGAVAELPRPEQARGIKSARLDCEEQRWSLRLAVHPGAPPDDGGRTAEIDIGGYGFSLKAEQKDGEVEIALTPEVLQPLRSGIRMKVEIVGGLEKSVGTFSLAGSRRTIDAIAPRCSLRDMSPFRLVSPSVFNPETALARELLDEEIEAFSQATRAFPQIAAQLADLGNGRRLLFATLCGSSWYFGNTGCNLTVHAQEAQGPWSRAYDTEGVNLYIAPEPSASGWPDLVALTPDGDEIIWRWIEGEYLPPISGELEGG